MEPSVDELTRAFEEQRDGVRRLRTAIGDEGLCRRAIPGKWSMVEHVAHLCLVNRPYLAAMTEGRDRARHGESARMGWLRDRVAEWFVRSMAPPVKRRYTTLKAMTPPPELETEGVLDDFADLQETTLDLLRSCGDVDLEHATFHSPFARMLRLTLHQGFRMLDNHNRRHLWLMDEVRGAMGSRGAAG